MRDQIDQRTYLNLREIGEPEENSLRLVIEEMRRRDAAEDVVVGDTNLGPAYRVEHTDACRVFEVIWETYVAYSVLNESYVLGNDGEISVGRRFKVISESRFIEYVNRETFADDRDPGPTRHIAICCESHIVNVVSVSEPQVRLLKAGRPPGVGAA